MVMAMLMLMLMLMLIVVCWLLAVFTVVVLAVSALFAAGRSGVQAAGEAALQLGLVQSVADEHERARTLLALAPRAVELPLQLRVHTVHDEAVLVPVHGEHALDAEEVLARVRVRVRVGEGEGG